MGVFLNRMVSEELMVKQKPKITERESCVKYWGVRIPRRNSQPLSSWGRDQL